MTAFNMALSLGVLQFRQQSIAVAALDCGMSFALAPNQTGCFHRHWYDNQLLLSAV